MECLDGDGVVESKRFVNACQQHPALAESLRELRVHYELGCQLVSTEPADRPGTDELLRYLRQSARDLRRFRQEREVGRGGMGIVLSVWDPELRRRVALKLVRELPPSSGQPLRERARLRLLEEAQVLGQLQHPGIVPVLELGHDEDADVFFTMPLVEGASFDEVIAEVHRGSSEWTLARAVGTLVRVSEAMAYAHSRDVVHRDLKPHNIMIGSYGETYVMDWGLAKLGGPANGVAIGVHAAAQRDGDSGLESGSSSGSDAVSSARRDLARDQPDSPLLSQLGEVVGTPYYMSPEQASGLNSRVDARSDIYGVGAILYHLLTGQPPYRQDQEQGQKGFRAQIQRVLVGPPESVVHLAPEAPEELVSICERAMQRDPAARYRSMRGLGDDLRAHLEGRVVRAHAVGPWVELWKWARRHRSTVALLAVLVMLALLSSIVFAVLHRQSERQRRDLRVAQADSLRRMSAGHGIGAARRPMPSFADSFDDGRLDRRWIVIDNPDCVWERDGELSIVPPADPAALRTQVALDPYVATIPGDFEVSLSYYLEGFDVPDVTKGERILFLQAMDTRGRSVCEITRHAERDSHACDAAEHTYRIAAHHRERRVRAGQL